MGAPIEINLLPLTGTRAQPPVTVASSEILDEPLTNDVTVAVLPFTVSDAKAGFDTVQVTVALLDKPVTL